MEYGLSHDLPIYSGGLGVLAGDIVKAAADQHRDFIAIGILWGEGYFVQDIDANGRQSARYVATPRQRLRPTGVRVEVEIGGETVGVTAWRVLHLGSVELLLLEPISEDHRWIARRLYGGSGYDRVAQEVLLGVGGVRVLRELGIPVDVYHFNEGHALFAGFELLREHMASGLNVEEAKAAVRADTVFTTHTPVPAGNETHAIERLNTVGANVAGLSYEQLVQIGGDPFQMTPAALRLCRKANAVPSSMGRRRGRCGPMLRVRHRSWPSPTVFTWGPGRMQSWPGTRDEASGMPCGSGISSTSVSCSARSATGLVLTSEEDTLLIGFARERRPTSALPC